MSFALPVIDESWTARRLRRLALAAAQPDHGKDEIAARLPLTAEEVGRARRGARAVPRRRDAVLLFAHRSRQPGLPGAHAGHPARARAGERAGRPGRSAGRGQPLARHRDLPPLPRPLPPAGARSLRDLLPPLQPAAPGRAGGVADLARRSRRGARLHPPHARHPRRAHLGRRSADAVDVAPRGDHQGAARDPARRDRPHRHARARSCCRCASTTSSARCSRSTTRSTSTRTSTTPRS